MSLPDVAAFRAALPSEGRLVLATHRHPDPDGLGGLVGMQYLLAQRLGLGSDLVLEGRIRRAENAAMRRLLDIRTIPKGGVDPARFKGIVLVDSQPGFTHTHPPGALPLLVVVDHHRGPDDAASHAAVPFFWVDSEYGATSTMVYHLLRAFDLQPDQRAATALFCGVRYDTNDLARDATRPDEVAYLELQRLADPKIVGAVNHPPLSRDYFRQMAEALQAGEVLGPLMLVLLHEVSSPESVAEIADWFLRLEGQQWSLAGGACDGRYQVSLRTDAPGADALPALKVIVGEEGSCGGHGRMAGGQIPLTDLSLEQVRELVRRRAVEVFGLQGAPAQPLAADATPAAAPAAAARRVDSSPARP
ncbi:MAG: hypothetical protein EYC70_16605 [Planctomycetota bacterium]|nr:MAG: hypothetical protein EYC70_16605 [Planctomycetota bacterium]